MSAFEISGQEQKPQPFRSVPPESDNLPETLADFPPDPLLGSGAFINSNNASTKQTVTETKTVQDHVGRSTDHNQRPIDVDDYTENVNGVPEKEPDIWKYVDFESPVPINAAFPEESRPKRGRRRKSDSVGAEPVKVIVSPDIPEWLPSGWQVEYRTRYSGASAGAVDRYYVDPQKGYKFRSKKEVLYFLQNGTKRKKGAKEDASVNVTSLNRSADLKEKRSGSRRTVSDSKFDFVAAPEKISWVLTDSSEGSWTPFIGDEKVPDFSKQEWAAAFTSIAMRNTGRPKF